MNGLHAIRPPRSPWWRLVQARRVVAGVPDGPVDPPWLRRTLAAGIWFAFLVTTVIVVLMVLAGQDPDFGDGLPRWLNEALAPDAWQTILLLVLAGCLAAACSWRMRRRTGTSFAVVAASFLVLLTATLAYPIYASCRTAQAPGWSPLSWTLALFVGEVETNVCPTPLPLGLQVARLAAILTTFLSLVAVVTSALGAQRDRLRVRRARSLVLVVGLDPLTKRFIEVLAGRHGDSTVVLLEPDRTNPLAADIRLSGVRVLYGDAGDRRVIERLLVRDKVLQRRSVLSAAYVLLPDASDVISVAGNVLSAVSPIAHHEAYPRLVARIDDPRQAEAWRRAQVSDHLVLLTDTVGLYRVTAQEVVDAALCDAPERLVILGGGAMALAIVEELVQHRREQAVRRDPPPLETIVVAEDGEELVEDHLRSQEWYGDRRDSDDVPTVIPAEPSAASVAAALGPDRPAHVIVALPPSPEQDLLTSRLALRHPGVRFLAWRDGLQGIAKRSVLANLRTFGLTLVATHDTRRGTIEVLPEDGWERIARRLHEGYVASRPSGDSPARRDWDDLSRFFRESNLRRVAVALQLGIRAGRTWLPPAGVARRPRRLTLEEVRALAHLEHESWCRYYHANGYRRGPRREKASRTLRHPGLVPWDELTADDRYYTVASLVDCLDYLEAMGYVPFESTADAELARFQRKGTVTARRRDGSWEWQTRNGATMSARPGDWELSDDDGEVWSITDEDFRRTYEHVDGDTYRRTGVVSARPAVAGEQVASTEGLEVADAHAWIVEDDAGKRWIVPGERFSALYEPEPEPARD